MNLKIYISSLVFILTGNFLYPQNGKTQRGSLGEEEHLFPGTGFFTKNRKPYDENLSKSWFREAYNLDKQKNSIKALKIYEKFAKRRSDAYLKLDGKIFQVGPESLFRAAKIREAKGDWSESFNHLKLLAQAYTDYDFELIADNLTNIAERLSKEKLPKKWGFIPRFRSDTQDRLRFNQIVNIVRGPKYAPRALMILAEISINAKEEEEAIDALMRLINLYPDHSLAEKAYFKLAQVYQSMVSGSQYDQASTLKALNFYEDYLILYRLPPPIEPQESPEDFSKRIAEYSARKDLAEKGRSQMRTTLASSKLDVGNFLNDYGKYFISQWRELGDIPARQFYNEAITIAPESEVAREAEKRILQLKK